MITVNFDINSIFNKIEEDKTLQTYLLDNGIIYDADYQTEIIQRIQRIYRNEFDLKAYWDGGSITTAITKDFTTDLDIFNYMEVPNGTLRIALTFGDDETIYEEELYDLNFYSLSSFYTSGITDVSSTTVKLIDTSKNFTNLINNENNYFIQITSGTNNGILRKISTVLTTTSLEIEEFPTSMASQTYKILQMPSSTQLVNYINLQIYEQTTNYYIKDYITFSINSTTNKLQINLDELIDEERKIKLTLSNSSLSGTQMYTIMGFNQFGSDYTSNINLIETFLNTNETGYISTPPDWDTTYLGTWNAYNNSPTIVTGVGVQDTYYKVTRSGSAVIGSDTAWSLGDIVYFDDGEWKRNPEIHNFTNYELLCYVFYLDDIFDNPTKKEIICRRFLYHFKYMGDDWFFLNNYNNFLPEYDYNMIIGIDKLKVFLESLIIEMDRIAYEIKEASRMNNIDLAPEEYLEYIASLFGYEKEEYELNNISFRELIKNLIDIYKIKGTVGSIELFFKFLGFSTDLKEYWFDRREVFNKLVNRYTKVASYTNFRHFLTIENPRFSPNKYKGLLTYENLKVPFNFDVVDSNEIQKSLNLFEFERLTEDKNLAYVLRLLGFGGNPAQMNHTWTYNRNRAILGAPKPPYWNGEVLQVKDLEAMDGDATYKYHQNDLPLFYEKGFEGVQAILFDHSLLYIQDKNEISYYIEPNETYEYFKTNFVTIKLYPFKPDLTSNDIQAIDKYLRFLLPIHVFFEPTVNVLPFSEEFNLIGLNDSLTVNSSAVTTLKYNHINVKYNGTRKYTKAG